MKKIMSILISLLLLASFFGIGTAMALPSYCGEFHISRTLVNVGDIFTATASPEFLHGGLFIDGISYGDIVGELEESGFPLSLGIVQLIDIRYYDEDERLLFTGFNRDKYEGFLASDTPPKWIIHVFRAVRPGKIGFSHDVCGLEDTLTVTPRPLPMTHFMRILGFGKLMRE